MMYKIQTLNNISDVIHQSLTAERYLIAKEEPVPDGILVRSASMHDMDLPDSLLAIARAGAGTNNIPIDECTKRGIVVFNTPGANANAVAELVICGLMLGSRNVAGGIDWARTLDGQGAEVAKLVEKGKAQFAGPDHLSFFQRVIHPSCDIRALPVKQQINSKAAGRVADAMHHRLNNIGDPGYMAAGDLAGHHDMAAGRQNFAGHTGQRVMSETIIQHAVCDLVAQFVGMPFRHRFGRIKVFHSHILLYRSLLPRCWSRGLSFPFSSYRSGRAAGIAQLIIEPHIIAACCALETPRI